MSTLVERALIADALAETPLVPLFTVVSNASILDAPADPDPYTSVSNVEIAEAFADTPVSEWLTTFCKEVIACELDVITESLTDCQLVPSYL